MKTKQKINKKIQYEEFNVKTPTWKYSQLLFLFLIRITFNSLSPTKKGNTNSMFYQHQLEGGCDPFRFCQHLLEGSTNSLVSSATTEKMLQHLGLPTSTGRRIQPPLQALTCPCTTQPPFYDKYLNLQILIIFFGLCCISSFTFLASYFVIDLQISCSKTHLLSTIFFVYIVFQWSCTTEQLHLLNIGMYLFIISMCFFNIISHCDF